DGGGDLDGGPATGGNRGDATDPWSGPPRWRRRVGVGLGLAGAVLLAAALLRLGSPHPLWPMAIRLAAAASALAGAVWLRQGPVCGPGTPGRAPDDGGPGAVVGRNISPPRPGMAPAML